MSLPRFLQITPPGRRALELIRQELDRRAERSPKEVPARDAPLSVDAEVTSVIQFCEERSIVLTSMLEDERTEDVRAALQAELQKLLEIRQECIEGLIEDQGGSLLWIWVSKDPSLTRGSRRFPQ